MKPKILFADRRPMSDESMKILHAAGQVVWSEGDKESELIKDVKDAEVVITGSRLITKNVIFAGNKLKGVIAYGVGFDHIDVASATEKGVYVVNTPGVNAVTVAEFAFGLMLGLARKIPQLNASVKSGKWIRWELIGKELWGKTLGLVGLGRVGTYLVTIGKGFGMKLLVYDPYVPREKVVEIGGEPVALEAVLRQSDFVIICCLLTNETKGLINEKAIRMMKATAYLINVARGPITDEHALVKALQEKRIAGAGLDVFEKEPPEPDNLLLKFDNVLASSHMAGLSIESTERIQLVVAEEAARILKGDEPKFLVNKELSHKKRYTI
jgi:D-3-phosphoglycerate dehydrogenase